MVCRKPGIYSSCYITQWPVEVQSAAITGNGESAAARWPLGSVRGGYKPLHIINMQLNPIPVLLMKSAGYRLIRAKVWTRTIFFS